MKIVFKGSRFGIAAAVIVFLLAGCDNDTGDNADPVAPAVITVDVRINSSSSDVLRGGEVTFLARVLGTENKNVNWSIDEDERHQETDISINDEGEPCLSVSEDETVETLTIRATSIADPQKSGTVKVTIPVPVVEMVEISLPQPWVDPWLGKVDTGRGGEIEFTAKVTGRDFIREAITWSIDDDDRKEGTTIITDANGGAQLRVAQDETLTSFKVQAVSKWDASKVGEVTVTVKEPTVTGVVILDHEGNIVPDDSRNPKKIKTADNESLRAIVTGTGKADQTVTWEIERLTYVISILDIKQLNGEWVDGWGSKDLVIDLDDDEVGTTWVKTGEVTSNGTSIYEPKPIERTPGSKEVIIWETNDEGENEQRTLRPTTGTTGIDANGLFTVDGQELFGKFRLTATSNADATVKKEVVVQIDSSSDINIDIPEV